MGPRGDIAWMCAPRWDSDAVFSALLGGAGLYTVTPADRWSGGAARRQDGGTLELAGHLGEHVAWPARTPSVPESSHSYGVLAGLTNGGGGADVRARRRPGRAGLARDKTGDFGTDRKHTT